MEERAEGATVRAQVYGARKKIGFYVESGSVLEHTGLRVEGDEDVRIVVREYQEGFDTCKKEWSQLKTDLFRAGCVWGTA